MTVKELRRRLEKLPEDADVLIFNGDGESTAATNIEWGMFTDVGDHPEYWFTSLKMKVLADAVLIS